MALPCGFSVRSGVTWECPNACKNRRFEQREVGGRVTCMECGFYATVIKFEPSVVDPLEIGDTNGKKTTNSF
jgi:hypothetical protein